MNQDQPETTDVAQTRYEVNLSNEQRRGDRIMTRSFFFSHFILKQCSTLHLYSIYICKCESHPANSGIWRLTCHLGRPGEALWVMSVSSRLSSCQSVWAVVGVCLIAELFNGTSISLRRSWLMGLLSSGGGGFTAGPSLFLVCLIWWRKKRES